ncbi:Diaminohydroxyphosphoribosylamino-pyrimidine deaminase [Wickerhamiella sorbophila]|uniref:Ribosomal lysine N-methyltransferase 5 n=1 Tax=Wickerhamiella sorbophila TaxID=45607 RepID=A0A2T0FET0_9ASCO|nr:Diaminohydroxyphosphoribosylamino-pyrimidine deaminase [Wickerhamiella sorbophila]PRT53480.1 Diaminohydroxyphosphoribosylamino-pyrimidine deaminase [Wickerhamiella sorbophila]
MTIISPFEIEDHIWELATGKRESGLGIIDRGDCLVLEDGDDEIEIVQSPSLLHEKSTGAVVWGATPKFAEWVQHHSANPLHDLIFNNPVVELGSGTGALARLLAPKTGQPWLATDQKALIKLAKKNTASITNVDVAEFDWEEHEFAHTFDSQPVIVAVDTIYNFFLIKPLIQGIQSVQQCVGPCPTIIVVQLRDEQVLETALTKFSKHYKIEYFDALPGVGIYLLSVLDPPIIGPA